MDHGLDPLDQLNHAVKLIFSPGGDMVLNDGLLVFERDIEPDIVVLADLAAPEVTEKIPGFLLSGDAAVLADQVRRNR